MTDGRGRRTEDLNAISMKAGVGMIELKNDRLVFSFPEVHAAARVEIEFQRTLRIPDDGRDYPLPPGLGRFPVAHVDDYARTVPSEWLKQGGVMLPMYQSEALWINFEANEDPERMAEYPFAVKIAAGKINAVSGGTWQKGLHRKPDQDYVVIPEQPWLDGFCVEKGIIRQFVAMPLGSGYSAEEQITGQAECGGLQIQVFPMKRSVYEKRFPKQSTSMRGVGNLYMMCEPPMMYSMGLAPGGRMRQNIEADPYGIRDWDRGCTGRCFVHIANSMVWNGITGKEPPHPPPTAKSYNEAGLPWFEWYNDNTQPISGSKTLAKLKSVVTLGEKKKQKPLPENASVSPGPVIALRARMKKGQVREFKETEV